jgi:hypothetical protein
VQHSISAPSCCLRCASSAPIYTTFGKQALLNVAFLHGYVCLQTNTTLEVLELNGNVIDYEGAGALAEALAQNTSLRTLGLRWVRGGAWGGGRGQKAIWALLELPRCVVLRGAVLCAFAVLKC